MRHRPLLWLSILLPFTSSAMATESVRPAVLLELFTSQGCSSCPPADRLLAELPERMEREFGIEVVPLSLHVDYWNRLGWRDPFSEESFSIRQRQYAEWMKEGRVYTPQLVVNGTDHCVGSSRDCIEALVRAAAANVESVRLSVQGSSTAGAVVVMVEMTENSRSIPLVLYVALRQRGLSTEVGSGENARRTLQNDFVVRRLVAAQQIPGGQRTASKEARLAVDPDWGEERLEVVAFLQDPRTGEVVAASQGPIARP
ncbi:MAG: DUF1223 domain-containing protein [Thermoanaerobaculia bacterium]|nr:DUF1223 domain-containing protein [Thermoanaerobaculia bacterium]